MASEAGLVVVRVSDSHDLVRLATEIDAAAWDEANDIRSYDVDHLARFVADPARVFLTCHRDGRLAGIASGVILPKPYSSERWLLVDEVDVPVDMRQTGAGRALMTAFEALGRAEGCHDLWLATEPDNEAANALYRSLDPTARETVIGYTWDLAGD